MRRVLSSKDFVDYVLKAAEVDYPHVICYSSNFPNMIDPEWREYVLARMKLFQQTGQFSQVKFSPPDELDDDWMFIATLTNIPDSHIMPEQIDYNPGPDTPLDWLKLIVLEVVSGTVIGAIIGGLILYFTGGIK